MLTKGEIYGDYYIVDRGGSYIIVDDLNTMKNMSAALSGGQSEFVSFDDAAKVIDNSKVDDFDISNKTMILPKSTTIKGLREKYNGYSGWIFLITYNNNSYATSNGITSDAQNNNIKVFFSENSAKRDINYRKNGDLGGIYNIVKVFVEDGKMRGTPMSI